jgi:SAM-dependent methyltransferase
LRRLGATEKPFDLSVRTHWEYAAETRMGKYLTNLETAFISKSIDLSQKNLTILDVGAEAGRFSLFAANNQAKVVSIDLDSYALKRLHSKNRGVHVIQADARALPLKKEVFDIVFMVEVLDYIPEIEQAMLDCKRTLKPNASCIISFGNKSSLKAKMRAMRGKSYRHSYGHIVGCLYKAGFTLRSKLGYSWLPLGRTSQNRLVGVLAGVERVFGLRRIVRYSPWVMIHITKPS